MARKQTTNVAPKRKGKPRPTPSWPERLRDQCHATVAAKLAVVAAEVRADANLMADRDLRHVTDILEGASAALRARATSKLGRGATQLRQRVRPTKHVELVRELQDHRAESSEQIAFKILRAGLISPLGFVAAAIEERRNWAVDNGKDPELALKAMLVGAGLPEPEAGNWIESAFREDIWAVSDQK